MPLFPLPSAESSSVTKSGALGKRHIFAEKDAGNLVLRRFTIAPGEKFIVGEDVVTRGGGVQKTIDIVRNLGGVVMAVGVIVDSQRRESR